MASASSDSIIAVEDIKGLLTCSMCFRTLNEPLSLSCLHTFCKACLVRYVYRLCGADKKTKTFPCPTCRSEFTLKSHQNVAQLPSIFFIKNMLDVMAIQRKAKASAPCSRCLDPAINHCATCEMFMCKDCSQWHGTWPAIRNHQVLSVQELTNPQNQVKMKRELFCLMHNDKLLEYYCETCKKLSCIHCMALYHQKQNHSLVAVNEIAQKQRETLQSSCEAFDEQLSEGKEALNNIYEMMKSLKQNAKDAKHHIKKQKENIVKILSEKLDEKAKKMYEEVDKVRGELLSELTKQFNEIKVYLDKLQASQSLQRNLLKRGSIEEVLSSQKLIDENIEKLANEKPENLVPVNDGEVNYVPEHIGNVNVDEILGKMGCVEGNPPVPDNLKTSSSILQGEMPFMKQLVKWLGSKCEWNLCYRASRDGWSTPHFLHHCDNKGPTVVLVKANDCIFGGYTDQQWDSSGAWKKSSSSFLFSLRNKDNLAPFIANMKRGQEQGAVLGHPGYGFIFGNGPDLIICNDPQAVQQSRSNFGKTYELPPGYMFGSNEAKNLLAGQDYFLTTEIEVFN